MTAVATVTSMAPRRSRTHGGRAVAAMRAVSSMHAVAVAHRRSRAHCRRAVTAMRTVSSMYAVAGAASQSRAHGRRAVATMSAVSAMHTVAAMATVPFVTSVNWNGLRRGWASRRASSWRCGEGDMTAAVSRL